MKVSDPIIFGHVVRAFFPDLFAEYGDALAAAGVSPNDGLGAILGAARRAARAATPIKAAVEQGSPTGPRWRWSTPTTASPTCTCRATSSSTPRCRR